MKQKNIEIALRNIKPGMLCSITYKTVLKGDKNNKDKVIYAFHTTVGRFVPYTSIKSVKEQLATRDSNEPKKKSWTSDIRYTYKKIIGDYEAKDGTIKTYLNFAPLKVAHPHPTEYEVGGEKCSKEYVKTLVPESSFNKVSNDIIYINIDNILSINYNKGSYEKRRKKPQDKVPKNVTCGTQVELKI